MGENESTMLIPKKKIQNREETDKIISDTFIAIKYSQHRVNIIPVYDKIFKPVNDTTLIIRETLFEILFVHK